MINIAVFVSGNGTNCENLIRHFQKSSLAQVTLVIANKPQAYALIRAERLGVKTMVLNKSQINDTDTLLSVLHDHHIDFIVLAGFLLVMPENVTDAYNRKMINIHPSLLPKFGGKGMWGHHVHQAVKDAGETETGFTVHWVSNQIDGGEIIAQFSTSISSDDSVEDIASKEHELEMVHFPTVVEIVLKDMTGRSE